MTAGTAYGALFHEFLVERYGRDRLETLAGRTAGRLPYFTSGAFRDVYGKSLGDLWREFSAWSKALSAADPVDSATRLTRLGFSVRTPRVGPDGSVWFSASAPHGFPGLYRLPPDNAAPERIASRFGGSGLSVRADVAVFDQLEIVRGAGLRSDLYVVGLSGRSVRRLTRHARLVDPDVSADGRLLVAVRVQSGSRQLVVLDAQSLLASRTPVAAKSLRFIATLGDEADVFAAPRFSPDGRHLSRSNGDDEEGLQRLSSWTPLFRIESRRDFADRPQRHAGVVRGRDGADLRVGSRRRSLRSSMRRRRSIGCRSRNECCGSRVAREVRRWRPTAAWSSSGIPPRDSISSRAASPCTVDTGGARPHGGFDTAVATPSGRIAMRVDTDGATPSGRVAMRFDDTVPPLANVVAARLAAVDRSP